MVKAAIIAGGKGTRIRSITGDLIPKSLVSVAGMPIVFWQLRLLARYNIKHVAVMAGHLAGKLEQAMPDEARRLGIELQFFVEKEVLGTAGGLPMAREYFADEDFLVLYGDIAVEMDLDRLFAFHRAQKAKCTIVAHPNDHPHESDLLYTDSDEKIQKILPAKGRIPGFYKNLVPAAVYCLTSSVFNSIDPMVQQDFIKNVFPRMIERGDGVYAYNTCEYLHDMGTLERYELVENHIRSGYYFNMNFSRKRPAIFFDRDGVLTEDPGGKGVLRSEGLNLLPRAAQAVKLTNQSGFLAVLTTNQPYLAKGQLTFTELAEIHNKLETLLGFERAKLDRIYYCPHHPETGYTGEVKELKIRCECRKPQAGMILKAASELPVDMSDSCVIGDTFRDIGAARQAGLYAYGVMTGEGCRDCHGRYRPDMIFPDVYQAVEYAVGGVPEVREYLASLLPKIAGEKGPFIIGICGLSQSGKTAFSHALQKELKKKGILSIHMRLDDWILPLSERKPGSRAEERSQVHLYPEILEALMQGREITAPGYSSSARGPAEPVLYKKQNEKVVILDGLFAGCECLRKIVNDLVFVDTDENTLISRLNVFYAWKGLAAADIISLLASRRDEEWPVVLQQREKVRQIVFIKSKRVQR